MGKIVELTNRYGNLFLLGLTEFKKDLHLKVWQILYKNRNKANKVSKCHVHDEELCERKINTKLFQK